MDSLGQIVPPSALWICFFLISIHKTISIVCFFKLFHSIWYINHTIRFDKLCHYGIHGTIHSWFKDYLNNRIHCTVYVSHISYSHNVSVGVLQSSILVHVLFLIYINDIFNVFTSAYRILFAEDMALYFLGPNTETLFTLANQDLNKLHNWCLTRRVPPDAIWKLPPILQ